MATTMTISTSAQWKTMSDKVGFGRDAEAFLRSIGEVGCSEKDETRGIRVTKISPSGDERATIGLVVSSPFGREECEFVLLREHIDELGIAVGAIDPSLMTDIEYYAEVSKAYSSACSSFAYTSSSLRALEHKLVQKGFSKDVASDAVAAVSARGFVHEGDIATRRAQLMVEKHWGRSRIIMKLREEGFGNEALESAGEYLAGVDFAKNCAALIRKKFGETPTDSAERNKMFASLSRMGYSTSDIRRAIEILR